MAAWHGRNVKLTGRNRVDSFGIDHQSYRKEVHMLLASSNVKVIYKDFCAPSTSNRTYSTFLRGFDELDIAVKREKAGIDP